MHIKELAMADFQFYKYIKTEIYRIYIVYSGLNR